MAIPSEGLAHIAEGVGISVPALTAMIDAEYGGGFHGALGSTGIMPTPPPPPFIPISADELSNRTCRTCGHKDIPKKRFNFTPTAEGEEWIGKERVLVEEIKLCRNCDAELGETLSCIYSKEEADFILADKLMRRG